MTTTQLPRTTSPMLPADGRRRRRLVLVLAIVVVLAAAATWLVAFSSVLGVGHVKVEGNHVLATTEIERRAAVPQGEPLLRLDTDAITRRVEQLPVVASAAVTTSLPATVVITVQERVPVGYLASGGKRILVDRTGRQYLTVDRVPGGLPRFVVPAGTDELTTGDAVATVAAALPVDLKARVLTIGAMDPQSITLVLRGGKVVRWGIAKRNAVKAQIVDALRVRRNSQIDVSNPDQPFTR